MLEVGLLFWSLGPLEVRQPIGKVGSHVLSCYDDSYFMKLRCEFPFSCIVLVSDVFTMLYSYLCCGAVFN
jgi:hypothetical protein